ncbi:MAG: UvrD-helicase domain-containing protein [Terracidiphilus sp.]|nr:UvrD-helicase domain-containing protein [Terracidiphilus sp.]MDR3799045.1 UvrD-helicase domain-containing protein [Terracidiphilus sp.]
MSKSQAKSLPPDQAQRDQALDPARSILVRAPAGSGKTTLLAERFLRLLAEVDEPGQVVAITFTNAAAAEMRNRILDELRKDDPSPLAQRALEHSQRLGWNLLDLPAQLRIQTIDSFCRDLALQQPLISGLGGSLEIAEQPTELYRRAARRTLEEVGSAGSPVSPAVETLLLWRDNNWTEMEELLVNMLGERDRWMHAFVLTGSQNWDELRERLEMSLMRAAPDATECGYTEKEWEIVRACFTLLRQAAAYLRIAFAEAGVVDFIEVAQIALSVLRGEDDQPTEAALAVADRIRHLLVDEFQDTSRRQHELLGRLIAAWPQPEGRSCFVVGDPMQSIYFFRGADAELFPRVENIGLDIPNELALHFDSVHLAANFRTAPLLVRRLNEVFAQVFSVDDGSGIEFSEALPAREDPAHPGPHPVADTLPGMSLHLEFIPQSVRTNARGYTRERKAEIQTQREAAFEKQKEEIVALIRSHLPRMEMARATNEKYRIALLGRTRKALVLVAKALREAGIPFRAIELEPLQDRPEIIDALALTRALLNPQDRVAWLGVLRAAWCGLWLADLHTLTSADDGQLKSRPVPELLAERTQLLSEEGRLAAARLLEAVAYSERLRSTQPTTSPGTWIERVWLRLGGAQCVDAAARANLDLLWGCLDDLPQGEQDFLGPALDAALNKLNAQPDPSASSDCGVQLMTIHKSKGLEFEVVVVPDLQANAGRGARRLLSWLERGLAPDADDSGDDSAGAITEFLVAPLQPKGAESGLAKSLVDKARRERESQEARRLLYVAATRAREELHLFARPEFKTAEDQSLALVPPTDSLLATAWPGLQNEVHRSFEEWCADQSAQAAQTDESQTIESLAASAENVLVLPAPPDAFALMPLRRLLPSYRPTSAEIPLAAEEPLAGAGRLYERHEGGLLSRALGKAVHELFQYFARLLVTETSESARAVLVRFQPRVAANIRAFGIDASQASRIAAQALEMVLRAAQDPQAQWVLAAHADAASETRWTGVVAGSLRTVQVDRIFRAGPTPQAADDSSTWWIVDYKTAHEDGLDSKTVLAELRYEFAPQIEAYAKMLRNLHGADLAVRGGLYYPRMALLDWWEL